MVQRGFYIDNNKNYYYSPDNFFSLSDSQIILFSISYELDIFNLIKILINNGLYKTSQVKEKIVGVGGVLAMLNPNLFLGIADIIFTCEYESIIEEFISQLKNYLNNDSKKQFLEMLSNIEGLSLPETNLEKDNTIINAINNDIPCFSPIISPHSTLKNMFLIEVSRSCIYSCRFCMIKKVYSKFRPFELQNILHYISHALNYTKDIGLISALPTAHENILEIINFINEHDGYAHLSSLRIEDLDIEFLKLLHQNKQNTLTLAPEVSSIRLKKLTGKNISIEQLLKVIDNAIEIGFKRIKLYYMFGFPEEDESDLNQLVEDVKSILVVCKKNAKKTAFMPNIELSINPFIPKPFTYFNNTSMEASNLLEVKKKFLLKQLIKLGGIKVNIESINLSRIQWLICQYKDDNFPDILFNLLNDKRHIKHLEKYL